MEYIAAGDVFQVNLSQRFTAGLVEHPSAIYERLRRQVAGGVWGVPGLRRPRAASAIRRSFFCGVTRLPRWPAEGDHAADQGHAAAGGDRGMEEELRREREGSGRAEHDRRPGAQRPGPGVRDRDA